MKRSILAIVTGVVLIDTLALAGDLVTERIAPGAFDARGFCDNPVVLGAMLAYTAVFCGLGGWVTARLARRSDMRDVRILAAIQLAVTLAANFMLYDRRLLWFYAAGLVVTLAAIVAGGRWRLAAARHAR
jgi:Ca2+/Na+ antiporter